jgi:hypothetical protein
MRAASEHAFCPLGSSRCAPCDLQGTPAGVLNKQFEHAIRTQDLPMAVAAARELPAVGLDRAARLLHLIALKRSPSFQKAAARWMARYAAERVPAVDELAEAAEALAEMGAGDASAAEILLRLCGGRTDL